MGQLEDEQEEATREKLRVPEITRDLIKWLRSTHPQRVIGKDETLAEAHRRAGMQDLIDKLDFLSLQQERFEAGELSEAEANVLVWEQEDVENGFVLRVSR